MPIEKGWKMNKKTPSDELTEEIYENMYNYLFIYAKSVLKDQLLAEEAIQDTFCIACAKRSQIFSSSNARGWIIQTLKNVLRNMIRTQKRLNKTIVDLLASERVDLIHTDIDWNVDILYEDIAESSNFKLLKMISLDNYSLKEAAEELGISVSACKKRVQRARNALRSCIHKRLSKVWKWEILTIASAEEREIS